MPRTVGEEAQALSEGAYPEYPFVKRLKAAAAEDPDRLLSDWYAEDNARKEEAQADA